MIQVDVTDASGAAVYRSHSARWLLNGCRLLVNAPDGSGNGPFFSIGLPLSVRDTPKKNQVVTYEGKGDLGLVHMQGGAAARDGAEMYPIARVVAVNQASKIGVKLVIDVELGEPILDSFGYEPRIKAGKIYTISISAPFDDLFDFADISKTTEAWNHLSARAKEFGHKLASLKV